MMPHMKRIPVLTLSVLVMSAPPAVAKPEHYEQLRVLLMVQKASCINCHAAPTSAGLNSYGKALSELGKDEPLSERMLTLDKDPSDSATPDQKSKQKRLQDIDGDGVPNWVEVLAGSSPGDATAVPADTLRQRVEAVVSCKACHIDNNLPGASGLASNPHNDLGKLLARTVDPKDRPKPGTDADAVREKAAREPILKRFKLAAMKPAAGGKPSYWEKLLLFCAPADAKDEPGKEEVLDLRRFLKRQKSSRTRDETRGMGPHRPDGFLRDAK